MPDNPPFLFLFKMLRYKKKKTHLKDAAICFSGQVKYFELCYPYIKKNLLENFKSYDVFCCAEDDENINKINLLNPAKVEKVKSAEVDNKIKSILKQLRRQNYVKFFFPESSRFNLRNVYQQMYKIEGAFKLLENYMAEKNVSYKYFIRIRFDFLPLDPINLSSFNITKNEIIVQNMNKGPEKDQINDMFCITSDFNTFKSYCSIYSTFPKIVLEKIPFKPSKIQKIYFFFEKKYVYFLFFFLELFPQKPFRDLLGILLIFPKKFYRNFKAKFRGSMERALFHHLKEKNLRIREEKINFVILRDPMTGLFMFSR